MEYLTTDVLVVGGGTGGTAAAIQAARRGVQVILVSEFPWLGGMLTSAGVCAPDGNELQAFQSGIWGAFLQELRCRQPGGLDHGWVSFFTYHPQIGAAIFADWVNTLPNLTWISGQVPLEVLRSGDRLTAVCFAEYTIDAAIILDGTELGDVLPLAHVPYRWGWELQSEFGEPSAPSVPNSLTTTYPVQTPTWVVLLQDVGEGGAAPVIPSPALAAAGAFDGAWEGYGVEQFLNYGRLPGDRFMINWPQHGNDYGKDLNRLIESPEKRHEFFKEALDYSLEFAHCIQCHLGRRYGLASDMFPAGPSGQGGGAFALHPYFRESRRIIGLTTVCEQDILPQAGEQVALLPLGDNGRSEAIALGNYPNDHHYPPPESSQLSLAPKSLRWGGRWTGTPFAIPYRCLVPATVDGLLVCEKNISVSHIANGATRLQPVVLGIGQAAGMAAALCVEHQCQPRALSVAILQDALLTDAIAPLTLVPLFNRPTDHSDWLTVQRTYLTHPEQYPASGYAPDQALVAITPSSEDRSSWVGRFHSDGAQCYSLAISNPDVGDETVSLVTLTATMDSTLKTLPSGCEVLVWGQLNDAGSWLIVDAIQRTNGAQALIEEP